MTPTPRTDAFAECPEVFDSNGQPYTMMEMVPSEVARTLERDLARRDALIQRILDYPYLPQNLATIIRKELDTK